MSQLDELDQLAQREAEYAAITRRQNRTMTRKLILGFAVSVIVSVGVWAALGQPRPFWWREWLAGSATGLVLALALFFTVRHFVPELAAPTVGGLGRERHREVRRAMWEERAVDDPSLLPLVEHQARMTRRSFPLVVLNAGLWCILLVTSRPPALLTIVFAVAIAGIVGKVIYVLRRSALVADLTRRALTPAHDWSDPGRGRPIRSMRFGRLAVWLAVVALASAYAYFSGGRSHRASRAGRATSYAAVDASTHFVLVGHATFPNGAWWTVQAYRNRYGHLCTRTLVTVPDRESVGPNGAVHVPVSSSGGCDPTTPVSASWFGGVVSGAVPATAARVDLHLCNGQTVSLQPNGAAAGYGRAFYSSALLALASRVNAVNSAGSELGRYTLVACSQSASGSPSRS